MSYLLARADGDWTDAATWGVVDATSLLDAQNANTALTTSFVSSATFAPGAITIDGLAVKVATRAATPSGTMSVRLAISGVAVTGTTVTIDVSDLPYSAIAAGNDYRGCQIGWVFFKFASPVLLVAATNYTLQATTSVASQVNLFRNATGNNWSRMLRTTTTGAPGAGDSLFVVGEWTAAGTRDDRSVVMDETATTDYGSEDLIVASLGIGKGGTLSWGTTPATDYRLVLSGILQVWVDGIYRMGTSAAPVPTGSTAELQFDPAADGQFGWYSVGEFTASGSPRTSGIAETWCLLNTDEAIGQTVLGVDRATGWLAGDAIAIASTTRTATQQEERTLSVNATATELTVSAGLTNAHEGTAPVQAEVILLTRNVRILSQSSSLMAFGVTGGGTVTWDWCESHFVGANLAGKFGHILVRTSGDPVIQATHCAFREGEHSGVYFDTGALCTTFIDVGSVFYAMSQNAIRVTQTATLALSLTDTVAIAAGVSVASNAVVTWSGVRVSSAQVSFTVALGSVLVGMISNLVQHSHSSVGVALQCVSDLTFHGGAFFRNNSAGLELSTTGVWRVTFESITLFGNFSRNVQWSGGIDVRFLSCILAGDTTFATTNGVVKLNANFSTLYFGKCVFSPTDGILVAHTTDLDATTPGWFDIALVDTDLHAATPIGSGLLGANTFPGSAIHRQRDAGTLGDHATLSVGVGTVARDATVYRTAEPSEKLTPASLSIHLRSGVKRRTVRSGNRVTFGVYVRKDASFNGAAPRLILRANSAVGIDSDVVLATHSAAADTWELLSGSMVNTAEDDGVVEAYVDCDGDAGNIYIDDWSAAEA